MSYLIFWWVPALLGVCKGQVSSCLNRNGRRLQCWNHLHLLMVPRRYRSLFLLCGLGLEAETKVDKNETNTVEQNKGTKQFWTIKKNWISLDKIGGKGVWNLKNPTFDCAVKIQVFKQCKVLYPSYFFSRSQIFLSWQHFCLI